MKTKTVSMRVESTDRKRFIKAARNHKNLSAFLSSSARRMIKFRQLIEQAEKLGLKTSAMKVVEK